MTKLRKDTGVNLHHTFGPQTYQTSNDVEVKMINYDEEKRLSLKKEKNAFEEALAILGCHSHHHHKTDSDEDVSSSEDESEDTIEEERRSLRKKSRKDLSVRDIHNSIVLAFILTIRASVFFL